METLLQDGSEQFLNILTLQLTTKITGLEDETYHIAIGEKLGDWNLLKNYISTLIPSKYNYTYRYIDDENEQIILNNNKDLAEAVIVSKRLKVLRIIAIGEPIHKMEIKPKIDESKDDNLEDQAPRWFYPAINALKVDLMNTIQQSQKQEESSSFVASIEHLYVVCNCCSKPITGIRYKCGNCVNFDLCENCEGSTSRFLSHPPEHVFLKIYKPLPNSGRKSEPLLASLLYDEDSQNNSLPSSSISGKPKYADNKALELDLSEIRSIETIVKTSPIDLSPIVDMNAEILTEVKPLIINPGTDFTMSWRVRNTGKDIWNCMTLFKCLNEGKHKILKKEVDVPPLSPGEDGFILLKLQSPEVSGMFYSSWQLFHNDIPFGPVLLCWTTDEKDCDMEPKTSSKEKSSELKKSTEFQQKTSSSEVQDLISLSSSDSDEYVVVPLPECFILNDKKQLSKSVMNGAQKISTRPKEVAPSSINMDPMNAKTYSTSPEASIEKDPCEGEDIPISFDMLSSIKPQSNGTETQIIEPQKTTDNDTGESSTVEPGPPMNGTVDTNQTASNTPKLFTVPEPLFSETNNEVSQASSHDESGPAELAISDKVEDTRKKIVGCALGVAATAYNSAKTMFALQSSETGWSSSVSENNDEVPSRNGAQLLTAMDQLVDMGFCNRELNQRLLREKNNDLQSVISCLLEYHDSDWHARRH